MKYEMKIKYVYLGNGKEVYYSNLYMSDVIDTIKTFYHSFDVIGNDVIAMKGY